MEQILIIDDSAEICSLLAEYILPDLGYRATIANSGRQGLVQLRQRLPDLILLDLQLPDTSGLDLLRIFAQEGYDVPVILMTAHGSEGIAVEAFRLGARNYLIKPFSETEARLVIDQALRERRLRRERDQAIGTLQQRVQELTVLYSIGKSVSAMLEPEELLERIVEAGVFITRAEEGFLLLRDRQTDELYLRAAKNIGEQRAQRLRLPITDTLAGQVVRTGKPIRLDRHNQGGALKVQTGFLVRALLQVPLLIGQHVIGVLAVDNQKQDRPFSENDQYLLSALADYAAVAIENARLYQQVKASEERYRDLFTNAYDLVFSLSRELAIVSINSAGEQLTGYGQPELAGRPLVTLCPPEAWPEVERRLRAAQAGQSVAPFTMELLAREGQRLFLEVSVRQARDSEPALLNCIARNLTDRRQLEQQLIQSEKLSALGQMIAGIAHELNNPLTSISGYTQLLLREKGLDEQVRQDLGQINTQAERAARIVKNLLTFAREHKPERVPVDINEVLRNTISLRAYQLRVDNITIVTEFAPELPRTVADPYQLQQVFLNLINNAHQAMLEKAGSHGVLTVRTAMHPRGEGRRREDAPAKQDQVMIEIADSGVGIAELDMSKIFDPFFTTKPVGQGTGLGLSICFGIIKEHEGRIWAESELHKGTRVIVELPLIYEHDDDVHATLAGEGLLRSPNGRPQRHILVVDDEEGLGQLLGRMLRDLGHEAAVVHSGRAALDLLNIEDFDLILSDIKMPGISGFDLHNTLLETRPDLARRLVFVSGDTLSPATQARIAQTGNAFIAKPFSIDTITDMLARLLDN
jgi:two-component system, NtrC family, sensor kinase